MVIVNAGSLVQKALDAALYLGRFLLDTSSSEALTHKPFDVLVVSLRLLVFIPYDIEGSVDIVLKGEGDVCSLHPKERGRV